MSSPLSLPVLDPDEKVGGGSFGDVFLDPNDSDRCIKRFRQPLDPEASKQLIRLVEVLRWARPSDAETLTTRFAWPLAVFGDRDEIVGFSMPRLPLTARFELVALRTTTKDLQAKYLIDASFWERPTTQSRPPYVSSGDRLEIVLDLAQALHVLHDNGLAYGDISANNIAIDLTSPPRVFLFDADSILTVSERARQPLVSPGWETPDGLDPIEIDRARFSLFVVRIFSQQLNVTPATIRSGDVADEINAIIPLLNEVYEKGRQEHFDEACQTLRSLRSPDAGRRAFNAAVQSEFARRVITERIHATEVSDKKLVDLAENQLLYETAYTGMAGRGKRKGLQREKLQRSGFKLDVPPSAVPAHAPRTEADLKNLVHLAMFEDIAHHYANNDLGELAHHAWTGRAVEHAHVEIEPPELQIKTEPGGLSARAWWPANPLVNVMRLRISGPDIDHTSYLSRGQTGDQLQRDLTLPQGGEVTVSLHAGCSAGGSAVIWTPAAIQATHGVSPVSQSLLFDQLREGSTDEPTQQVVNPAAVREQAIVQRLEDEARRGKQPPAHRRRVAAWVTAVAACVAGGVVGYPYVFPGATPTAPTPTQAMPQTQPEAEVSVDAAPQPAGLGLRVGPGFAVTTWTEVEGLGPNDHYLLWWGDGTRTSTERSHLLRNITTPITLRPMFATVGWIKPAITEAAHAAITITDPDARPDDAGLPKHSSIGFDTDGIYITLSPPPADPTERFSITITNETGLAKTRFQTNWQPEVRIPVGGPGTWTVSVANNLEQSYRFPTITLDPEHPSIEIREDTEP